MNDIIDDIIRRHCRALQPQATGHQSVLRLLPGIKAVLFDVYGTLFISASGDVGTADLETPGQGYQQALETLGIVGDGGHQAGVDRLTAIIRHSHDQSRAKGIAFPEVDIRDVWRELLQSLEANEPINRVLADSELIQQLSTEYEVRTNPVWPMPGCETCLTGLRETGLQLGIVSNAQFYTAGLFSALLGATVSELGFDARLLFYSYQFGQAKPGVFLYERARDALAGLGIAEPDVLYVGNDMRNDIMPAAHIGFRTALFAGDARSLRLREDDASVAGVVPDLVLTDLAQLPGCVLGPDS